MPAPIQQLNIYITARKLEDATVELAGKLPKDQAYPLGDDLRRAATGVAHYVYQAHNYYSYEMKVEALHQARGEAEKTQQYLQALGAEKVTKQLVDEYTTIIKQSWGLIKYFKTRQAERAAKSEVRAKDELVASRH